MKGENNMSDIYTKKERIKKNGEVFTPDNIVNDMLNMLEEEYPIDIDTTVLEPTCGDGQILIRLLWRKLQKVKEQPMEQRELALLKALSGIYGVDIEQRNVDLSKTRLKSLIFGYNIDTFSSKGTLKLNISLDGVDLQKLEPAIDFILHNNIILGNTLEKNVLDEMFVYLTSYQWNEDFTVVTHKCPITNLGDEQDEKIINYLDLKNIDTIPKQDYKQHTEDKSCSAKQKPSSISNLSKFGTFG